MAIGRNTPSLQSHARRGDRGAPGATGPTGPAGNTTTANIEVKDEGSSLTATVASFDFVGAGVTATNSGDNVTVTIPGTSGGSGLVVKDEGGNITTNAVSIDFVGAGVTATDSSGNTTVTIPGYTDEQAQDAVGTILVNTATINLTYSDSTPSIKADLVGSGVASDYSAAVLVDTPTAYWKCDEVSGTLVDSGGGGYNLTTAAGTLVYQHSPLLAGDNTPYLMLNSTGAQMKATTSLGIGSFPLTGDWTCEAIYWRATNSIASPGQTMFFSMDAGATDATESNNCQVQFYITSGSGLGVRWESSTGTERATTSTILSMISGTPYHIVAVKDSVAKTITFYVNGRMQKQAEAYTTEPTGGTGTMVTFIGANSDFTAGTGTILGHVAFYNGIKLSATRIFAHARAAGLTT